MNEILEWSRWWSRKHPCPDPCPLIPHVNDHPFHWHFISPSSHHNPQLSQAHLHAYLYSRPANLQKPLHAFNCIAHNTPHDCSHKYKFSLSQTKSSFSWKHLKRIKLCKKITHTPFPFHIHSRLWFFDFGKFNVWPRCRKSKIDHLNLFHF